MRALAALDDAGAARHNRAMLDQKTLYIIRHAETVFNRAKRMQGNSAHTPLTAGGVRQAQAIAAYLATHFKPDGPYIFWCSTAGRTRQTAAVIADAIGHDYFDIRFDERLREIDVGDWTGQLYADITAKQGLIVDEARKVYTQRPPNGEWYDDVARRLTAWAQDVAASDAATHLVISHGLASRVLRGVLSGAAPSPDTRAPIAEDIPQGHIALRAGGGERILAPGGPLSQTQAM